MKKLLFSTLSIAAMASAVLVGCKDNNGGGGGETKAPKISFQTNTGTQSGYTFTNEKKPVSTGSNPVILKIGVIVTSEENLKSTKMTVKFNNQGEVLVGTDSVFSSNTKTCNRDYFWRVPEDKGTYTLTAYATDKNSTTTTATIVITAFGPLAQRADTAVVYSLKATKAGHYSAYDLLTNEAISAADGSNISRRDIVDASTTSTLGRVWKSGNGTEFKISTGSTMNGKVYSQFQSEQDLIDAWNASGSGAASTTVSGIDDNRLIIAKSNNGGTTRYYLISVWYINDDPSDPDEDYYWFQYKE